MNCPSPLVAVIVAVIVAVAGSMSAQSATITIRATLDTTLYAETWPSNTSNGAGENLFVGTTAGNAARRALIWFDLSAIASGSVITGASLSLTLNKAADGGAVGQNVSLHRALGLWAEGTSNAGGNEGGGAPATSGDATWTNRFFVTGGSSTPWNVPGGDFAAASANTSVGALGRYVWTGAGVMGDVQDFVNSPGSNFGWFLIGNEAQSRTARRFASSENASSAARPSLVVTFTPVPEPSATLLALAGCIAWVPFRRRK